MRASCNSTEFINATGGCEAVLPNCITYNPCGECLRCPPGTENINGLCRPYPITSLCEESYGVKYEQGSNTRCKKCVRNAFPTTQTTTGCQQIETSCSRFGISGVCELCNSGYSLKYFSCVSNDGLEYKQNDLGCRVWAAGICAECLDGFGIGAESKCVKGGFVSTGNDSVKRLLRKDAGIGANVYDTSQVEVKSLDSLRPPSHTQMIKATQSSNILADLSRDLAMSHTNNQQVPSAKMQQTPQPTAPPKSTVPKTSLTNAITYGSSKPSAPSSLTARGVEQLKSPFISSDQFIVGAPGF